MKNLLRHHNLLNENETISMYELEERVQYLLDFGVITLKKSAKG